VRRLGLGWGLDRAVGGAVWAPAFKQRRRGASAVKLLMAMAGRCSMAATPSELENLRADRAGPSFAPCSGAGLLHRGPAGAPPAPDPRHRCRLHDPVAWPGLAELVRASPTRAFPTAWVRIGLRRPRRAPTAGIGVRAGYSVVEWTTNGGGGIRTLVGAKSPETVFETAAFNRSATPPSGGQASTGRAVRYDRSLLERCPSGRRSATGNRVGGFPASRVQIPPSPLVRDGPRHGLRAGGPSAGAATAVARRRPAGSGRVRSRSRRRGPRTPASPGARRSS
jgi:hypothetical protein